MEGLIGVRSEASVASSWHLLIDQKSSTHISNEVGIATRLQNMAVKDIYVKTFKI